MDLTNYKKWDLFSKMPLASEKNMLYSCLDCQGINIEETGSDSLLTIYFLRGGMQGEEEWQKTWLL